MSGRFKLIMKKQSIQHYVSKMFIKRFMKGRHKLHTLFVDTSSPGHGTLKKSFGEKGLWSDDIEQKIGTVEAKLNRILQIFDATRIDKQSKDRCTVRTINNQDDKNAIIAMALLRPKLLKDLKDGKDYEKNILNVLDNSYLSKNKEVFYVKLYEDYCTGKFVITDYLGQIFFEDPVYFNSLPVVTIEELKSGKIKDKSDQSVLPASYFITGEYEFFFVGKKEQLNNFLKFLLSPIMFVVDKNGNESECKKLKIDFFELTAFNLNEIKSQESQCEIASYDEKYLKKFEEMLPEVVSSKVIFRKSSVKNLGNIT